MDDETKMEEGAVEAGLANIGDIMGSEGPVVKAVYIATDGGSKEIDLDTTAKTNQQAKVLGGAVSFCGMYADVEGTTDAFVLMVNRGLQEDEQAASISGGGSSSSSGSSSGGGDSTEGQNAFDLPWPLHEAKVRGPILVVRMNEQSEPKDLLMKDFMAFILERRKMPVPEEEEDAAVDQDEEEATDDGEEEAVDDEEEGEDEESDDEEGDEDDDFDLSRALLKNTLRAFNTKHGRSPNEDELKNILSVLNMLGDDEGEEGVGEETEAKESGEEKTETKGDDAAENENAPTACNKRKREEDGDVASAKEGQDDAVAGTACKKVKVGDQG